MEWRLVFFCLNKLIYKRKVPLIIRTTKLLTYLLLITPIIQKVTYKYKIIVFIYNLFQIMFYLFGHTFHNSIYSCYFLFTSSKYIIFFGFYITSYNKKYLNTLRSQIWHHFSKMVSDLIFRVLFVNDNQWEKIHEKTF